MENEDILKAVSEIQRFFSGNSGTLSVAESCTGGLICHYLTAFPGASAFFEAGLISYSVKTKINILGVSPDIIETYGVVSMETARDMAEKMASLAKTSCALAITGNLGPGVLDGKERGLAFIGVCNGSQTFAKKLRLSGDRLENKGMASLLAINFLIEVLNGKVR